ncbi:hypothetical protein [Spirosoma spitsbergense]|uniref:hypothetical protein n=1 Tax=Spirosoma spitsbergense TaxID=431554 RepID=UPI002480F354|nr:hypothetical protein [Spirosoma spitsbergense]
MEKHNAVVLRLGMLLSAFVDTQEVGIVRLEKALVELTRNSYEPDICYLVLLKPQLSNPTCFTIRLLI